MPKILKAPLALLGAALALSLTACGNEEVKSTPDPIRFARVVVTPPAGEAQCDDDGDGRLGPCLSQAQADRLFNDVVTALCAANDRLAWLSDYYLGTQLPPSCGQVSTSPNR